MALIINEKLNLVVPVESKAGTIFVHSIPFSIEAFERYFSLIWQTHARIIKTEDESLGTLGAPRVAAMMLKQVSVEAKTWDAPAGGGEMMAEIRRLSMVAVPGANGWQSMLLSEAVDKKVLDATDQSEVENTIVFFIVSSAMLRRGLLQRVLDGLVILWDARTTSLGFTEYLASLPKLTDAESSGATAAVSSVPS